MKKLAKQLQVVGNQDSHRKVGSDDWLHRTGGRALPKPTGWGWWRHRYSDGSRDYFYITNGPGGMKMHLEPDGVGLDLKSGGLWAKMAMWPPPPIH